MSLQVNDASGVQALQESYFDQLPDPTSVPSPVHLWPAFPGLTESHLFKEYKERLAANRDIKVYITAGSETGVGKTTLAIAIAILWDQHGWTMEKATLDPREYESKFWEQKEGSVLILDEAEQAADSRDAMKNENKKIARCMAMGRHQQIFSIMTLPSRGWLEKRIRNDMADYWIECLEGEGGKPKGEARVYRLRTNEHYERTRTKRTETISWPVMDTHPAKIGLDNKKRKREKQQVESSYVEREAVDDIVSEQKQQMRNKIKFELAQHLRGDISQGRISKLYEQLSELEGVSQQRVSHYQNAESIEEVFS